MTSTLESSETGTFSQPRPFRISVDQEVLDDLNIRLGRRRLLNPPTTNGWDEGTNPTYLEELLDYWEERFDWRAQERIMNDSHHFLTEIDDRQIHFIHERGEGPAPLPLILTHGYPDSFLRFSKLIPLLTDPERYGGDAADCFDVVVPSLPGFGFSQAPEAHGETFRFSDLWAKLMVQHLGYTRFGAHGGDWGSTITEQLARDHSTHLAGIHLTDVPFLHAFPPPDNLTRAEKKYLASMEDWQKKEGGYYQIQGTRPSSLAQGLNDSPAGLAAWIVEKFQEWSDCNGDIESCFTKDELINNLMIYWVTQTIGSSFLPYYDLSNAGIATWTTQTVKKWLGSTAVPAGFANFPKDISHPPREWAERFFSVQRWTEMPRGGHFAAMEQPELLANDIREFFRPLRTK